MLPPIKKMTFFKVNDPKNRELIKEVIAKRAVIREADRRRKMGEAFEFEQLSRFFKPITKQAEKMTEKIEKGVKGLPGEIAKILPRPINIMQPMQPIQPPPAYEAPFAGEAEIPKEEPGKEIDLPDEVKETEEGYQIGILPFQLDEENKNILLGDNFFSSSPKIYELLTNKNSGIKWNDLNEQEKYDFGRIATESGIIYSKEKEDDYENMKYNKNLKKRWNQIYKPIWYNRFLYMEKDRLDLDIEKNHMERSFKQPSIRRLMTNETKKLIKSYFPNLKGEGLKGSGLKKNYVTLPSDPSELVDRLTLLAGSKDAGNTGVYNEMVSICAELLKKKIIGKGQYKEFLSNI